MERVLFAVMFLVIGLPAYAIPTLILDNPDQIIERPLSSYVDVDFYGTLTLDAGQVAGPISGSGGYMSTGDFLYISDPALCGAACWAQGYAYRFSVRVNYDDLLGVYDLDGSLSAPGWISMPVYDENTYHLVKSLVQKFSVTVVANSSVPEPSALLLMGIGLAGLGFVSRKKKVH